MANINITVTPNEFFTTNPVSTLTGIMDQYNVTNCPYGYIFLGYPNWNQPDIDLFKYLDKDFLSRLQTSKTLLLVDYTYEGFSYIECPIIKILETNCKKHNINPKQVFYFTGNLRDTSELINVIPIFLLDRDNNFKNLSTNINDVKDSFLGKKHSDIVLSLSRRNRYHRVLAHIMLFNSDIKNLSVISQDVLNDTVINNKTLNELGCSEKQWKRFQKSLPLLADGNNFHINDPFNPLNKLHHKTCFSIVNETLINDWNNTSIFFSEKILKPIINFQPMIIYGQPGINHALTELGFKTYENYFDLSFDHEKNNVLRYKKLLESVSLTAKQLSTLSVEKQLEWRFEHLDILKHNYNNFILQTHSNAAGRKFADAISKI